MKKTLVWDLPTRLLHWGFAATVSAAFVVAFAVDDESPLFQLHMIFGLAAAFLAVVRIALGLVGSRHARFRNFPLKPMEAVRYAIGVVSGRARSFAGNNPGSAWAALAMLALVPLLALSGIGSGGEAFEDLHEVLAYALLAIVGAHLAGLALHGVRHHENPALPMITGRKDVPSQEGISSAHGAWGLALLGVATTWIVGLFASHDPAAATVRLPVVNQLVNLGESREGEREWRGKGESSHRREDDDHR
ncbi:hypothetical protein MASR2M8_14610 [Opitutaceae bacterium]